MCTLALCCVGAPSTVVTSRLRSLKCVYVSRGRNSAGQAFPFLSRFLFSFFAPPISLVFFLIYLCDKEQKKEGPRMRLLSSTMCSHRVLFWHKSCRFVIKTMNKQSGRFKLNTSSHSFFMGFPKTFKQIKLIH